MIDLADQPVIFQKEKDQFILDAFQIFDDRIAPFLHRIIFEVTDGYKPRIVREMSGLVKPATSTSPGCAYLAHWWKNPLSSQLWLSLVNTTVFILFPLHVQARKVGTGKADPGYSALSVRSDPLPIPALEYTLVRRLKRHYGYLTNHVVQVRSSWSEVVPLVSDHRPRSRRRDRFQSRSCATGV